MKKKEIKKLLGKTYDKYVRFQNEIKNTGKKKTVDITSEQSGNVNYKSYARFEEIKLPKEKLGDISLKNVLIHRESWRYFEDSLLSLNSLSTILKYSFGINQNRRGVDDKSLRYYPSAGGRFPLEVYVVANRVQKIPRGVYHYYLPNHSLEKLFNEVEFDPEEFIVSPWFKNAASFIILSTIPNRTTSKYGDLGYRFVLNEAGFAGQNIYLVSEALNVGCSAASYYDDEVEKLLGIDGVNESISLCFAIGNKAHKNATGSY